MPPASRTAGWRGPAPPPVERETPAETLLVVDADPAAAHDIRQCLAQHSRLDDLYAEMVMEFHAARTDQNLSGTDVRIAASPDQALALADGERFACLIADCRFDDIDGVDFFARFLAKQPDCVAILVSAAPNLREVAFAIPRLFTFLTKPWNDFELRSAVAQALAHRRIELENRALAANGG